MRKIIAVLILCIFVFSVFDYRVQDRFEETVSLDKLQSIEDQNFFSDQDLDNENEQKLIIQNSIQEPEWKLGQSVHVEYDNPDAHLTAYQVSPYYLYSYDPTAEAFAGLGYTFTDDSDGLSWPIMAIDDSSSEGVPYNEIAGAVVWVEIPAFTSGTLYYDFGIDCWDNSGTYTANCFTMSAASMSIDSDDLDPDGFLRITIEGYGYGSLSTHYAKVRFYIESGTSKAYYNPSAQSHAVATIQKVRLNIDQLNFVRDNTETDVRSEYKQASVDSYIHSIKIPTYEYLTSINIDKPLDWNISHTVPYCSFVDSGNTVTLTDLLPVDYEIFFSSVSPKQYLAIDDKSSDYLSDIGFEGSYLNDWIDRYDSSPSDINSIGLNSTIVSEGAFSVRIEDSDSTTEYLYSDDLIYGEYYLSFDYYIESITASDTIKLHWKNDGSNVYHEVSSLETDRWHKEFVFVHITDYITTSPEQNIRFSLDTYDGVFFLDNLKIWKVNNNAYTSAYQELTVEANPISWDGYSNPSLTNFAYEFSLYDRTSTSEIVSTTVTTDSTGKASWVVDTSSYSELQDQREIEIRSWSYESYFGCDEFSSDPTESQDLTDFEPYGFTSDSESFVSDATWGSYSYQIDALENSGSDNGVLYRPASNFEIKSSDMVIFYVKSNVTIVGTYNPDWYVLEDGPNHFVQANFISSFSVNTWTRYAIFFKEFTINGDPDTSDIDYIRFDSDISSTSIQLNFEVKLIQTQKSYFTPLLATDFPYYYETDPSNNEWDFSEETDEDSGFTDLLSESFEDGLHKGLLTAGSFLSFWTPTFSIEAKSTHYFLARMKCNDSTIHVNLYDTSDSIDKYTAYHFSTTDFETIIVAIGSDSDWTGTETRIRMRIDEEDGTLDGDEYIQIDYIRIVERDIPSLSVADSYAYLSSSNNSFKHRIETDSSLQGYYSDLEEIGLNQSVGSHTINATCFSDSNRKLSFIPSSSVTGSYSVTENDLCSILITDQSNEYLDAKAFKIYVDTVRIYGDSFFWSDTSSTVNLTITDKFDNLLYQNTTESYSRFVDVVLTLYSVKIMNLQAAPVHVKVTRGSKTFSEWLFNYEIIQYKLESDTYTIAFYYSSLDTNFEYIENTSYVSYAYNVNSDTAIMINGNSITDVFNNVLSLASTVNSVNTSLTNQIVNVNISLSNQNTDIENQIVNVDILLTNTNTSLSTQLVNLTSDISNVNTTLYAQTVTLLSNLANVNTTLYSQTVSIISKIENTNSTLYSQSLEIISDIYNTNLTLYNQMIDVITNVTNYNSSTITQILRVYSAINNIEPADPNIEVVVPEDLNKDDFDNLNNRLDDQDREISILGSLLSLSAVIILGMGFLYFYDRAKYRATIDKLKMTVKRAKRVTQEQGDKFIDIK